VADLDAIGGGDGNPALLTALAREASIMVDAGVTEPQRARALLDLGAHRVIVGTETLSGPDALDRLLEELPAGAVIPSVDLRDGRLLSPDAQLAGLPALDAMHRLPAVREAIVLDLARVGSGAGPDVALIAEIHAAFPDLELLAGGGVRDVEDLRALDAAGAAGALVATALHSGVIGPRELAELR
jgi:phosphoribosylformimino-5-aminoimidazole carboxamide ribotide isomerase